MLWLLCRLLEMLPRFAKRKSAIPSGLAWFAVLAFWEAGNDLN
jgi:hypothetical protein